MPPIENLQRVLVTLLPRMALPGVARVSLGIENTEEDVDRLVRGLEDIARSPKSRAHGRVQQEIDAFVAAAEQRVYGLTA